MPTLRPKPQSAKQADLQTQAIQRLRAELAGKTAGGRLAEQAPPQDPYTQGGVLPPNEKLQALGAAQRQQLPDDPFVQNHLKSEAEAYAAYAPGTGTMHFTDADSADPSQLEDRRTATPPTDVGTASATTRDPKSNLAAIQRLLKQVRTATKASKK